jgi:hypothetical protein
MGVTVIKHHLKILKLARRETVSRVVVATITTLPCRTSRLLIVHRCTCSVLVCLPYSSNFCGWEEIDDELPQAADARADGARHTGKPLLDPLEWEDQHAVGHADTT